MMSRARAPIRQPLNSQAQVSITVVDTRGKPLGLVRAPDAVRASVPVFHPQAPALAALAARVKESFDPKGLFNPGRMG